MSARRIYGFITVSIIAFLIRPTVLPAQAELDWELPRFWVEADVGYTWLARPRPEPCLSMGCAIHHYSSGDTYDDAAARIVVGISKKLNPYFGTTVSSGLSYVGGAVDWEFRSIDTCCEDRSGRKSYQTLCLQLAIIFDVGLIAEDERLFFQVGPVVDIPVAALKPSFRAGGSGGIGTRFGLAGNITPDFGWQFRIDLHHSRLDSQYGYHRRMAAFGVRYRFGNLRRPDSGSLPAPDPGDNTSVLN